MQPSTAEPAIEEVTQAFSQLVRQLLQAEQQLPEGPARQELTQLTALLQKSQQQLRPAFAQANVEIDGLMQQVDKMQAQPPAVPEPEPKAEEAGGPELGEKLRREVLERYVRPPTEAPPTDRPGTDEGSVWKSAGDSSAWEAQSNSASSESTPPAGDQSASSREEFPKPPQQDDSWNTSLFEGDQ